MMIFNPDKHHRKSIRLKNYDYSQAGAYFITICTQNRDCLFGEVINGKIQLNTAGIMIHNWWDQLKQKYPNVELNEFIVMPNHLHGILILQDNVGTSLVPAPMKIGLGDVIGSFKSSTTNEYIKRIQNSNWPPFNKRLWQRNYYEHIIRDENELNRIRKYIVNNPLKWDLDKENPINMESN